MFLYSHWRSIPLSTRIVIATAFGIAKIGPTHVSNNVVESDGYKIDDVERALNVDKLQEYTGSESTDMQVLFDLMVAKAEGRIIEPPLIEHPFFTEKEREQLSKMPSVDTVETPKKKRVYKKKTK
jgi:hypothetical protein